MAANLLLGTRVPLPLQRLCRPAMYRDLGFELSDPLLRCGQLDSLSGAQPGFERTTPHPQEPSPDASRTAVPAGRDGHQPTPRRPPNSMAIIVAVTPPNALTRPATCEIRAVESTHKEPEATACSITSTRTLNQTATTRSTPAHAASCPAKPTGCTWATSPPATQQSVKPNATTHEQTAAPTAPLPATPAEPASWRTETAQLQTGHGRLGTRRSHARAPRAHPDAAISLCYPAREIPASFNTDAGTPTSRQAE